VHLHEQEGLSPVIVTFVVKLVREQLAAGELVGKVELVSTGEEVTVQSAEELVSFALRAAGEDEPATSSR
jgi:hypothetical protein